MSPPRAPEAPADRPSPPLPRGVLVAGCAMAGVIGLAFLAVGLAQRQPAAWLGASGLFALYFGAGLFRLPRGAGWLDALPWLIFAAPLTPLTSCIGSPLALPTHTPTV